MSLSRQVIACATMIEEMLPMAVLGLQARNSTLIMPRVDDCTAIFLGSGAAYKQQVHAEPGTYDLTYEHFFSQPPTVTPSQTGEGGTP